MTALTLVLLVIPATVVVASDRFSDVPDSNIFHADIDAVAGAGVTLGCGSGKYCPSANVTRGQMAAFLNRTGALGPGKFPVAHAQSRVQTYCAVAAREPSAYPLGPCRTARTAVATSGDIGRHSSIAIGADGLPIVSYHDNTNGDLRVTHCGNEACTSGNVAFALDTTGSTGEYTSIVVGTDGLPVIAYRNTSQNMISTTQCLTTTCSSASTPVLLTGTTGALYLDMALGADGTPVISYYDSGSDDLEVAKCADAACTLISPPSSVASTGDVGLFTSIAVGTDGLPVISFEDTTNGSLKVARCGDAACSDANVITAVDEGNVGRYSSVAIGVDGIPIVSYYDIANGDLKVVHCGTADCTSGRTVTTVDSDGDVGWYTSIAIDASGLPVIAYRDNTNLGRLKLARCRDVTCATGSSISTVDTVASVGSFTSTAIGVDGLPIISYYHSPSSDLAVVRAPAV